MPSAVGRRQGNAGSDARLTSLVRQSCILDAGAALVPFADRGHLLRNAWFQKVTLRAAGPAMYWYGVRDRDDHQIISVGLQCCPGTDYASSRRPQGPRAS